MTSASASDSARPRRRVRGSGCPAVVVRWVGWLALLDSWSPDGSHRGSPSAARRQLRDEWSRSGALTEAQARALLTLDETTPWQV